MELLDLDADQGEKNDLAASKPAVMKQIERILATCHTEPMPQVEPKRVQGRNYF